jgi:transcriptional regulator with XRE-family HTH domain
MTNPEKPLGKPTPSSIEDGIGIRLKAARETKSMSQIDLHNRTGLSRTVLINYEAGRHKPGTREIRLLCDALEVSPNHLIYGTEEPHIRTAGLADTILNMGQAAVMPVVFIAPMLGAMLGKDDTRLVLSLIESLLKAKSPEDYAAIMIIVGVFKEISDSHPEIKTELLNDLQTDPVKLVEFHKNFMQRIQEARNKAKT